MIINKNENRGEIFSGRSKNLVPCIKENGFLSLFLEVASACNLKCQFCDLHSKNNESHKGLGIMPMPIFKKAIRNLKKVKSINYVLHGEPLLNPHLPEMVATAVAKNLADRYVITTNGVLLTPEKYESLIRAGANAFFVSLDRLDRKSYLEFKGKDFFDQVMGNIMYAFKNTPPDVSFSVRFSILGNQDDLINDATEYFRKHVENSPNLHLEFRRVIEWPDPSKTSAMINNEPCELPFYQIAVSFDGIVTCCCADITNSLIIGNLKDNTLDEIVNGKELLRIKKTMLSGNLASLKICQNCIARNPVDFGEHLPEVRKILGVDE